MVAAPQRRALASQAASTWHKPMGLGWSGLCRRRSALPWTTGKQSTWLVTEDHCLAALAAGTVAATFSIHGELWLHVLTGLASAGNKTRCFRMCPNSGCWKGFIQLLPLSPECPGASRQPLNPVLPAEGMVGYWQVSSQDNAALSEAEGHGEHAYPQDAVHHVHNKAPVGAHSCHRCCHGPWQGRPHGTRPSSPCPLPPASSFLSHLHPPHWDRTRTTAGTGHSGTAPVHWQAGLWELILTFR